MRSPQKNEQSAQDRSGLEGAAGVGAAGEEQPQPCQQQHRRGHPYQPVHGSRYRRLRLAQLVQSGVTPQSYHGHARQHQHRRLQEGVVGPEGQQHAGDLMGHASALHLPLHRAGPGREGLGDLKPHQ